MKPKTLEKELDMHPSMFTASEQTEIAEDVNGWIFSSLLEVENQKQKQ